MTEDPHRPEMNPYAAPDTGLKSLEKKFRYSLPERIGVMLFMGGVFALYGGLAVNQLLIHYDWPRFLQPPSLVVLFLLGSLFGWWFTSSRLPPSIKPPGWDEKYGEEES